MINNVKDASVVILEINGAGYTGWTDIRVSRSMDSACSEFSFSSVVHPVNSGNIKIGGVCRVLYDGQLLLTGRIDYVTIQYNDTEYKYSVSGRSLTKDIVDCSVASGYDYNQSTIRDLASALAAPYGIEVVTDSDAVVDNFVAHASGETVFAALQRVSDTLGLIITDDEAGRLVIGSAGRRATTNRLVEVLSGSLKIDESERYSEVIVKGQGRGSDDNYGTSVAQVRATATDRDIARKKTIVITADKQLSNKDAQQRANYEVSLRAGKGITITYEMRGWAGRELWREGTLINVDDPLLGVSGQYLISAVDYNQSDTTTCSLSLCLPSAYDPEPDVSGTADQGRGGLGDADPIWDYD